MDWQRQVQQHAAQQPVDEGRHQFHQSEGVLRQQHSSSSTAGSRETATPGPGLGVFAPAADGGSTPYLYPPEWQQGGRPQPLPHRTVWRQQPQQQQIWQQEPQLQQGPSAQQTAVAPPSPRTSASAYGQQRRQRDSSHGNNIRSLYSSSDLLDTSSDGCGGDSDSYMNRSGYGGAATSHVGPTASRSYGGGSSSAYDGYGSWQQQQLLLEQEQQRNAVQEVEKQCMQSLQSSLRMAAETNEISQKTAVKLDEQSEQLREIRDTTAEIHENLQTSDYLLKGMKSWWGAFAQLFTSPPAAKPKAAGTAAAAGAGAGAASRSQSRGKPSRSAEDAGSGSAASGARVRSDSAGGGRQQQQLLVGEPSSQRRVGAVSSDFDVRLEQDLQKLSDMLGEMHERAVAINSNLKQQNGMLSEIEKNVDANQSSIAQQKKVLKEIMRK